MSFTDRTEGSMTEILNKVCEEVIIAEEWAKCSHLQKNQIRQQLLPIIHACIDAVDAEPHRPKRGDEVEAWIKRVRDEGFYPETGEWGAVDTLLDDYRLHADTGTPLSDDVQEG